MKLKTIVHKKQRHPHKINISFQEQLIKDDVEKNSRKIIRIALSLSSMIIPLYQMLCWISSIFIICKNKGRFHLIHTLHAILRSFTLFFQTLTLVYMLFIQMLSLIHI